ncbi:uncharacterized protein 4-like [Haliotis cracherodii]|uniref:uncharacterized protein 4-like n=1 Tax=Haliotis cracherodii TaxID=6455 RepID=UPI0039EC022E
MFDSPARPQTHSLDLCHLLTSVSATFAPEQAGRGILRLIYLTGRNITMNSLIFLAVLCTTAYVASAQSVPLRPAFLPGPPAVAPRVSSKGVAGLVRPAPKSLFNNPYLMMMGDKYFDLAAMDMLMDPTVQVSPVQQMIIAKNADLNPVDMMFVNRMRGAQGAASRSVYFPAILSMM